ncbi:MAG: hypothetical protein HY908_25360 [Myxococcales bacterium]|nr:hypothetical protein [Myxococcales bacterium]
MPLVVSVPAEFVAFMQYVVEVLDGDEEDDRCRAESADGLQCALGYGGRSEGGLTFVFFPAGRAERWVVTLGAAEVRAIAAGEGAAMVVESEPWAERRGPPAARLGPPARAPSPAESLVDELVRRGLVVLVPQARREVVARFVGRVVAEVLEHPTLSDPERAAAVVEALVALAGIDDVFGEDAEILALARRHLGA